MASTGGGKIRPKRSKKTSKPYARRSSFLGRVSETVRDFITPSWLSNMWQGATEEEGDDEPVGSREKAFTSNALPDLQQQRQRQQVSFAPPQNRPNLEEDIPVQTENLDADDEPDIMEEQQPDIIMEDQPSTSTGQGGHKTPFNRYTQPLGTSTPNDEIQIIDEKKPSDKDDAASDTSVSTSGCSSLVPHIDKADHREKLSKFNLDRLSEMARQRSDSPRFRSDSPRLRSDSPRNTSLWSETSMHARSSAFNRPSRPQQSIHSSRKPTFNSSYFCTPRGGSSFGNTTVTDSPNRSPSLSSPFYPGKTTFGGSSAQRPAKRPRTSPYEVHLPVKRHVRIRPSNRNEVDVTSQTAKRILETLEKMSTPLSDAKKIPLSPTSSPFSFTPGRSTRLRQHGTPHPPRVQERAVKIPGPPRTGLQIPQVASIADNRQPPLPLPLREPKREAKPETVSKPPEKPSFRLPSIDSSSGGFKMTPSTSTTAPARTHTNRLHSVDEPSKSGGKMKSSKREQHYKSPVKDEDDVLEVPNLPNVPLPLANGKTLPTFKFRPSKVTGDSSGSSQTVKPLMASTPLPSSGPSLASEGTFKFSSPIVKETSGSSTEAPSAPVQSLFKFSAPKQPGPPDGSTKSKDLSSPPKVSFNPRVAPLVSNPQPSATEEKKEDGEDEEEETSGGIKVAKTLKKGSCLEVFGMLSKSSKESTDAKNPQVSSGSTTTAAKLPTLAEKFKPAPGTWSCEQCLVKNKPEADKCVCCSAAKPGSAQTPQSKSLFGESSIAKPTDASDRSASKTLPVSKPVMNCGFGDKFKKPAGTWKCDTCLVKNPPDKTKCVCCQSAKPGGSTPAVNSTSAPPAAATTTATFGFGDKFKPAPGSWKCDTCLLKNKSTVSRCVACETPKPGSQQTLSAPAASAYKFGNSSTSVGGVSSSSFKFGAPSTATTSSETKQDSKPSGLQPFKFGKPADDNAKSSSESAPSPGGFKLNTPVSGFKFGNAATNSLSTDENASAPPPNADPFKSGALRALETTKPVVDLATTADSEPNAAKVTSAATKQLFKFGTAGAKTDNAPAVKFSTASSTTEQKSTFSFGGPKTDAAAEKQAAATNPVLKFGGSAPATENKDSSSKPAFAFGNTEKSTASTASDTKSIFGASQSKPPAQIKKTSEQSASKPLFNFKSSTTNTNFQFGSSSNSSNAAEQKPAQDNKAVFNFIGAADNKPSFNFGAGAKPTENKDTGSTNSTSKPSGFVFGGSATTTAPINSTTNTSNTTPAASVTPFKFGDSAAQNSGTYVFGGTPASTSSSQSTTATAASAGGFSFTPSVPATTQQPAPAFGGFGSNASSANPSPVFGNPAPSTTSTSVPNFGTAANTPFGSQNQQQGAAPPAFGAANSGTPFGGTPAPAFGAGSTPAFGTNSATPAFGSGNNSAPAFGNNNNTQQNTAFQANATPSFQFGAAANQTPQQNSGVFKFGATENNSATPAAQNTNTAGAAQGFNFNAQQAPSFNFSATAASAPSPGASPFQFNASGSGSSNPFNPMPTSSTTHSGRKIKRAVRRNMRK